jgi:UDP-N-acetyl-D-mannosaminuronate dehydrogenase
MNIAIVGLRDVGLPLAMQFACSCATVLEKSVEWNGATIESFDLVLIATQPFIGPLSRTC